MDFITKSADETKEVGRRFAHSLKVGNVVALVGGMGAGKTTFVQGVAEGLGIRERVISPTFIIMRKYEPNFYHVDLYRLEGDLASEVENLGLIDLMDKKSDIIIIEWAERIKEALPKNTIWVSISETAEDERKITI